MNIRLIDAKKGNELKAGIFPPGNIHLPSLTDGWKFNFRKHARLPGVKTFVLSCDESPAIIEGCLIFIMKDEVEPYMSYIETSPHNQGKNRKYLNVAECLIAYACRLSFIHGTGPYKGWLAFDVLEEKKDDEIKLMALYCRKYGAVRFDETTTLVISPEAGEALIDQFLK